MRPRVLGRAAGNMMRWLRHPPPDPVAPWLAAWTRRHPVGYGLIVAILAGLALILATVVVVGLVRAVISLVLLFVHDPMRVLGPLMDLASERIENLGRVPLQDFYGTLPTQIQRVVFWAVVIAGLLVGWGIIVAFWGWMKRRLPLLSFLLLANLAVGALYMAHEAGMPTPPGWLVWVGVAAALFYSGWRVLRSADEVRIAERAEKEFRRRHPSLNCLCSPHMFCLFHLERKERIERGLPPDDGLTWEERQRLIAQREKEG
jgi:hypothetical protein